MGPTGLDLRFAFVAGLAAVAMVGYLLLLILGARMIATAQRIRRSQFVDNWDDVLAGYRTAVSASISHLRLRDMQDMIERWNAAISDLPEALDARQDQELERQRLRRIAQQAGLAQAAFVLLNLSGRTRHLAAITSLGHIRSQAAWNRLVPLVRDRDPYISLAALQALVRIDELIAAPYLTNHFSAHLDWPEHAVSTLIGEVSEATRETLVLYALNEPSVETSARIYGGLDRLGHPGAGRLLHHLLESAASIDDIWRYLYATTVEPHVELIDRVTRSGHERARSYAATPFSPENGKDGQWESEPPWVRALAAAYVAVPEDAPTFE